MYTVGNELGVRNVANFNRNVPISGRSHFLNDRCMFSWAIKCWPFWYPIHLRTLLYCFTVDQRGPFSYMKLSLFFNEEESKMLMNLHVHSDFFLTTEFSIAKQLQQSHFWFYSHSHCRPHLYFMRKCITSGEEDGSGYRDRKMEGWSKWPFISFLACSHFF